ncbi:hypothetical protein EYF80_042283 [Liparis tanakae]|uniref:Uncharacterized protein n=1 Tax=Liparis tanakae TaxID=230148 RepID=A0A4Z2G1S4_9TELE|nr:hypothetical protein EYF80_042283 [Liparis tanakae]
MDLDKARSTYPSSSSSSSSSHSDVSRVEIEQQTGGGVSVSQLTVGPSGVEETAGCDAGGKVSLERCGGFGHSVDNHEHEDKVEEHPVLSADESCEGRQVRSLNLRICEWMDRHHR